MDSARRVTDQQISAMRREFASEYDQLGGSMSARLAEYLADHVDDEGRVEATALTGRKWDRMRDQLAREVTEVNSATMRTLDGRLGEVRALTAEGSGSRSPVPRPAIDQRADVAWNRRKVEAAARQGIGKTPAEAGERMRLVADMNSNATARRVRTAINGAENAGRMDAMLARGGSKRWITMADELVRDSHAALHGVVIPVDEPFDNGLMFPGDPSGPPEEVYNCRCVLEWVDTAEEASRDDYGSDLVMNEEWTDGDEGYRVFEQSSARWDGEQVYYFDKYFDEESGQYRLQRAYGGGRSLEEVNERKVGFDWWNDRVSEAEQKTINSYQNSSAAINGQLRAGEVTSANATKIRKIEHALDEAEVGVPFVCQREANSALLGFDRQASVEEIRGMVGEVVQDKGFMSCSPTSKLDYKFGDNTAKGMGTTAADQVQYHIAVPEGKGIGGLVGTHSGMVDEFILNRGAQLRVVGAFEHDGVVHCNLQWVGREVDPLQVKKKPKR